jgi:hypothetical protein
MRKLILLFSFLLSVVPSNAQKKYRCEFAEIITSVMPDSVFRNLASKNNLSAKEIEEFIEQQKANPDFKRVRLTVRAEKDQTIINVDTLPEKGSFRKRFDSLLYKNDEIFNSALTLSGFSDKPYGRPKRAYRGTGKKLSILNYQCDEFISTDSTVRIWVSTELPEYINPGARTNNVKGAVLGFQLIQRGIITTTTKAMLVKLQQRL